MDLVNTPQTHTLRLFSALWLARPVWAGTLVLGVGLGEAGRALSRASLAVGAAGLFLESDPSELRTAQREGCCTFSVSTLEEAVRALKNEVRQGRAITVAVRGEAGPSLAEIVRRGIQPAVVASERTLLTYEQEACAALLGRGSIALHSLGLRLLAPGIDLETLLQQLGSDYGIQHETAHNMIERRAKDQVLIESAERQLPKTALLTAAQRWLRLAPSLFPRALDRAYLSGSSES